MCLRVLISIVRLVRVNIKYLLLLLLSVTHYQLIRYESSRGLRESSVHKTIKAETPLTISFSVFVRILNCLESSDRKRTSCQV